MIRGWKKLSKEQLRHLKEAGITETYQMEQEAECNREQREHYGSPWCLDCEIIAKQLDY